MTVHANASVQTEVMVKTRPYDSQFLRIKKLIGKNIVKSAARHNLREIAAERGADSHIDAARISFNRVLRGEATASGVALSAQALMDQAGVKTIRKDGVRALEILFSLNPDLPIDRVRFFDEAMRWVERTFNAPILSAVVHNDEAAPHCHVLVLPLMNGRMRGSELVGRPAKLKAMQSDFYESVGKQHGLAYKQNHTRPSLETRQAALDNAYAVLEANSGLHTAILQVLLAPHLDNPEALLQAIGLSMPQPSAKLQPTAKQTFVGIMTKPMKPESMKKPIEFGDITTLAKDCELALSDSETFADFSIPEKTRTLSCVGFGDLPKQGTKGMSGLHEDAAEAASGGTHNPKQFGPAMSHASSVLPHDSTPAAVQAIMISDAGSEFPDDEPDNRQCANAPAINATVSDSKLPNIGPSWARHNEIAPTNATRLSAPLSSHARRTRRARLIDRQQTGGIMRWVGRTRARHKNLHAAMHFDNSHAKGVTFVWINRYVGHELFGHEAGSNGITRTNPGIIATGANCTMTRLHCVLLEQ